MKKNYNLFLSLFIMGITGCSTPAYFSVPAQHFESPAVSGETLKLGVGAGIHNPMYVVTVKSVSASDPLASGAEVTREPDGLSADLNFFDNIAIDLRFGLGRLFEISSVPGLYTFKFQFLGSSRSESKANEFLGAIVFNQMSTSERSSSSEIGGSSYKTKVVSDGLGGGLILGYRSGADVVFYLHANYLKFDAKTEITQPSQVFNYKGSGNQEGLIFGIRREAKKGYYAGIEASYTKTVWEALKAEEYGTGGFIFGYDF